jgi:hypothetical protein
MRLQAYWFNQRLTGGTESVVSGEFPHASKELGKTTTETSHAYNSIGGCDATRLRVIQGENEGGRREGEKATGEPSVSNSTKRQGGTG